MGEAIGSGQSSQLNPADGLQLYISPPLAVSGALVPNSMVVSDSADAIAVFTVMEVEVTSVPQLLVTVTEKLESAMGLTVILLVVSPVLQL